MLKDSLERKDYIDKGADFIVSFLQNRQLYSIHLHNLEFFAFHGIHEEERKVGNHFVVSLDAGFEPVKKISFINDTIDYTSIFEIVRQRMQLPTPLLETVAEDIIAAVYEKFPNLTEITISIFKLHPPVPGCTGKVGVSLQKKWQP